VLALGAEPTEAPKSAKEALQPFNGLIATWKGTGYPEGTREERAKGFWVEKLDWKWHFEGETASLKVTVADGKYFTGGELRYLFKSKQFELALTALDKSEQVFVGKLAIGTQKEVVLTLERAVGSEVQQITFTLLHSNRYLYQLAAKPKEAKAFTRIWQVGATKEGEPFAELNKGPECIVSGGRGTMSVSYKGKTYFVCCSGCKDEFNADPAKYIKLAAEKKK
jgi:YHS domain-containing protein/outer membrane lipoprotein-sorting protein